MEIEKSSVSMEEERWNAPILGITRWDLLESHLTSTKCSSTLLNIARQIILFIEQVKYNY